MREIGEKLCLRIGYLPLSLRYRHRMKIYDKANRAYAPKVYPGRIIIYKDEDCSDPQSWGTLAAEGFEIHEVPGDHLSVLAEENVKIWGKRLSADLNRMHTQVNAFGGRDQEGKISGRILADREPQSAHRADATQGNSDVSPIQV